MKLKAYLDRHGITDDEFAGMVSASPYAVIKWKYGQRVPRKATMKAIVEATKGAVTPADFFPADAAEAGAAQ